VATLRAGVYPRRAAILVIIGWGIAFFPVPLVGIVFSATAAYLGYMLFTGRVRVDEQPRAYAKFPGRHPLDERCSAY
jgi:hypothetical protein